MSSMVFGSLILLLLLATTAHGLQRLDMHAAPNKKVTGQQEEIQADFKWQRRPSSSGSPADSASAGRRQDGMTPVDHDASTARAAAAEEDGEVKKRTRTHRVVAPTLIHEDYAGPSGHSPNHHRTIRCGPY
ncbi:hypothetical protein PVAP13_6NG193000 [Panicum virgatum]|uniref:Uncharacterized protein n=1 Tax=Panicum virgatum TaxID=38727 RepID=A0A8T0QWJ7_PANVG|nr:hypothetical protein PVAP13_6NG193000 [Panicum virgatum]